MRVLRRYRRPTSTKLGGVGLPGAILEAFAESGSLNEDAWIELHLIGLERGIVAKAQVVGFIRFRCGAPANSPWHARGF